jgi:hypothetical protein
MQTPRFSHINSSNGEDNTYAVDILGRHYMVLWYGWCTPCNARSTPRLSSGYSDR